MFLHCWAIVRADSDVRQRLDAFLNLYGFSRNMSVASLASAVAVTFGIVFDNLETGEALGAVLALMLASIVLVYRYLKFFRLYTKEVFVRYIAHPSPIGTGS